MFRSTEAAASSLEYLWIYIEVAPIALFLYKLTDQNGLRKLRLKVEYHMYSLDNIYKIIDTTRFKVSPRDPQK